MAGFVLAILFFVLAGVPGGGRNTTAVVAREPPPWRWGGSSAALKNAGFPLLHPEFFAEVQPADIGVVDDVVRGAFGENLA
jgi:hypothetical protein